MIKHENPGSVARHRLLPGFSHPEGKGALLRPKRHGLVLFLLVATIAVAGITSDLSGNELLDVPAHALLQLDFVKNLLALDSPLRSVPDRPIAPGNDTRPLPPALPTDALPTQLPELDRAMSSYGYATSVGGIAFGRIATPAAADIEVTSLHYDPAQPDGARLRVMLRTPSGDVDVAGDIPDWQLIPIARFAGYNQASAFTAFGKLVDVALEERARSLGYYIYNYHRGFEDTLLGLRLLQADMLIIRPEAVDLPKQAGAYLLGFGEQPPDIEANTLARTALQNAIFPGGSQQFQSYIITDAGQNITFSTSDGKLILDGFPYWQCWKSPPYSDAEIQSINDVANQQADDELQQEYAADATVLGSAALSEKYTTEYRQARFNQLWDQSITPQMLVSLPDVSAAVSDEVRALGGVNPAVYEAVTSTMRYAALFRRSALLDPAGFAAFAASLDCVQPEPWVNTPSLWAGSGLSVAGDTKTAPEPGSCWTGGNEVTSNATPVARASGNSGCSCRAARANVPAHWAFLLGLPLLLRRSLRRIANCRRRRSLTTRT